MKCEKKSVGVKLHLIEGKGSLELSWFYITSFIVRFLSLSLLLLTYSCSHTKEEVSEEEGSWVTMMYEGRK